MAVQRNHSDGQLDFGTLTRHNFGTVLQYETDGRLRHEQQLSCGIGVVLTVALQTILRWAGWIDTRWRPPLRSMFAAAGISVLIYAALCPIGFTEPANPLQRFYASMPMAEALERLALESGLQILFVSSELEGLNSRGAPGSLTPKDTLARLIEGTPLRLTFLNDHTVTVARIAAKSSLSGRLLTIPKPQSHDATSELDQITITGLSLREPRSAPFGDLWTLPELRSAGIHDMSSLMDMSPGVEYDYFSDFGAGIQTNLAIRGINARDGSTTAIFVDGVPLPADPSSAFGRVYPTIFDLSHVEIARGPQGVMDGETSEGGSVHFISKRPSLTAYDLNATSGYFDTARGDPSWEAGAAAGGPVWKDVLGVRLSAWKRTDGGYVDRVNAIAGVVVDPRSNYSVTQSGRAALSLDIGDNLHVTATARHQTDYANDTSAFYAYLSNPSAGVLRNGKFRQQPLQSSFTVASLQVQGAFRGLQFESITGRYRRSSYALYNWYDLGTYADVGTPDFWLDQDATTEQVSVGSSHQPARWAWIAGGSLRRGHHYEVQDITNWLTSGGAGFGGRALNDRFFQNWAAFLSLTYTPSAAFTATFGMRVGNDRQNARMHTDRKSVV